MAADGTEMTPGNPGLPAPEDGPVQSAEPQAAVRMVADEDSGSSSDSHE